METNCDKPVYRVLSARYFDMVEAYLLTRINANLSGSTFILQVIVDMQLHDFQFVRHFGIFQLLCQVQISAQQVTDFAALCTLSY